MPETREAFGARMADALGAAGVDGAVFAADAFAVTTPHGTAHLDALWQRVQGAAPRDAALLEAAWVAEVVSVPVPEADPEEARTHLRVRATPRAAHTRRALEGLLLGRPYHPVGRRLGETTVLEVVYAIPGHRPAAVHADTLARWGLSPEAAFDEALARRLADGVRFVPRGAGWATAGPADGLAALALMWHDADARDAVAARAGLGLPDPVFVPLRDDTLYAYDPTVEGAAEAVAASIARVVAEGGTDPRWLGVDGLRPTHGAEPVLTPVARATRDRVRLAHHRLAYGAPWQRGLLSLAYGGHQADLQLGDQGLRAVPTAYPALLGEAETVVIDGEERPFAEAGGRRVDGLWPPVWLLEAPPTS